MTEYVSRAMSEAAKESAVLLYASGADPFLEELSHNADRVWYFDEGPRASPRLVTKSYPKSERNQMTLEVFSQ